MDKEQQGSQPSSKRKNGVFTRAKKRGTKKNKRDEPKSIAKGRKDTQKIVFGKRIEQPLEDQLFDYELKALEEVKKLPIVKEGGFKDEFIMACLFARKLDVKRTDELLQKNLKWRRENGYEILPTLEDIDKDLIRTEYSWLVPGNRTKDGHGVAYAQFAKLVPSDWGHKKIMDWMIWVYSKGILIEGMDWHRNGIVFIEDLGGFSWKHWDSALQQKMMTAIQNNFPMRLKEIYLLHPPSFLKAILKICKLFMKKKLLDRVKVVTLEDVRDRIPEDELCVQFGGTYKCEVGEYVKIVEEFSASYEKDELEARRKRIESGEQKVDSKKKEIQEKEIQEKERHRDNLY